MNARQKLDAAIALAMEMDAQGYPLVDIHDELARQGLPIIVVF